MALQAKELIEFLKKNPEAYIRFVCNIHFGDQCGVDLADFEYDHRNDVFILPNLCMCLPEPD